MAAGGTTRKPARSQAARAQPAKSKAASNANTQQKSDEEHEPLVAKGFQPKKRLLVALLVVLVIWCVVLIVMNETATLSR